MKLRHEYLVSYDIEDNKVRNKVHKQLLAYGLMAVQKSVFWGCITGPELGAVQKMFEEILEEGDKVFIVRVNTSGMCYRFGYESLDFQDWAEYGHI